jgi:ketosteroid isomerase-like protein
MKPERRILEWQQGHDGTSWLARGARGVGGYFQITRRQVDGGEMFDIHRLVQERGQCSYLGSATSLDKAKALGQSRHAQMRTGNEWQRPVMAKKIHI